jgi:hypothetical protein
MAAEENGEFRGFTRAQIDTLFHAVDRIEKRQEKFEGSLVALSAKLDGIQQWRARVIGYASAVSLGIGGVLHWMADKFLTIRP